jgi:hypothetical protein
MTPLKNRERDAPGGPEAAELRRLIAELQGSLSWKITAPLRMISKPLFRAMAPKTVPPAKTDLRQTGEPVPSGPAKNHGDEMTKADALDSPTSPTLDTVSTWYGVHPKFAHAVLETFLGVDYDRGIGDIHAFLARYQHYRLQLDYTFSTNTRGRNLAEQLRGWGVPEGRWAVP